MSNKLHGSAKHAMWMAHASLFSRAEGDAGVESNPDLAGPIGVLADPAADAPTYGPVNPATDSSTTAYTPYITPTIPVPDFTTPPTTYGPVNPNPTPAASGGGLLADFAKQTSTVAGLQNLLTQATASGTTIASQIAPLTKKGKKNAAAATDTKGDTTKDKSKIPPPKPTKILGMSVPVFGVVAFLVVGGIVVGGLYAAGVIGGGSSSTTTVPLVPNLVSKAA